MCQLASIKTIVVELVSVDIGAFEIKLLELRVTPISGNSPIFVLVILFSPTNSLVFVLVKVIVLATKTAESSFVKRRKRLSS